MSLIDIMYEIFKLSKSLFRIENCDGHYGPLVLGHKLLQSNMATLGTTVETGISILYEKHT